MTPAEPWRPAPVLVAASTQNYINGISASYIEQIDARPVRAIAYCRVSTSKQDISLDVQRDQVRALAIVKSVPLMEVIVDQAESAKSLDRPGITRLLSMVDSGTVNAVFIAKLDRITRSVRDLIELLDRFDRKDVALVSAAESLDTGSAVGRMMLKVMMSVSEWERETIAERTCAALQKIREQGRFTGRPPYGYRAVGADTHVKGEKFPKVPIEADPYEQENLATIKAMRAAGATLRGIAEALNAQGRTLRSGKSWKFSDVQDKAKRLETYN